MLSAWLEYTDIYLAQGVALLKVGATPAKSVSFATTLPWSRVFQLLGDALLDGKGKNHLPKRLRITLSGTLCPAVAIDAPKDARRWSDLEQLLPLSASASLGQEENLLACSQEATGEACGAAMGAGLLQDLKTWAKAHEVKLHSFQPSWALASESKAARVSKITSIQIVEVDGVSLLCRSGDRWHCHHLTTEGLDHSSQTTALQRYRTGLGLEDTNLLKLNFSIQAGVLHTDMPTRWAAHWSPQ